MSADTEAPNAITLKETAIEEILSEILDKEAVPLGHAVSTDQEIDVNVSSFSNFVRYLNSFV